MISVNTEITELKSEFEGGKSFSIDWFMKLKQGANAMLDNLNPETLKRVVPIYGGLTKSLQVYYCPSDVEVPSRLYNNEANLQFDYVPPRAFYAKPNVRNVFTIEYVNNARFIVVRHPLNETVVTVDDMDDADEDFGGDVSLSENTYNILPGATTSLEGTFTDALYTVNRDISSSPLDISNLLKGVAIVPLFVDSGDDVASVKLILKTDDSNYYTLTSTLDSVGDYLRDGQNMVRFWMNSAVKTGTPTPGTINEWELQIQMETGKTQTVIIGKVTVQSSHLFQFEYYSNLTFIDKTTGAWKDTPVSGDYINLNRDTMGILHFETCRLVIQSATTERINAAESTRIDTNLARKYTAYFSRHPSSEQPLSYDIMPEIALSPDPLFEMSDDNMPDSWGDSTDAFQPQTSVNFADAEVPTPAIDGVTTVFALAHVPDPASSVQAIINGQILTLGQDYTLSSRYITLLSPYYTTPFVGTTFIVNYRYSV